MQNKTHSKKHLSGLFSSNKQLNVLFGMLKQQSSLLSKVKSLLPAPLSEHISHVRSKQDLLIIHTDSPVWVSKLHFFSNQLLDALRADAPMLKKVKIRVYIPQNETSISSKKPAERMISQSAKETLKATAKSMDDEALKEVLMRISEARNK